MLKLNEAILLLVYAKLSGTVKNGSDVDMALRAKDIAEMIGVSQATLSLVINNIPSKENCSVTIPFFHSLCKA